MIFFFFFQNVFHFKNTYYHAGKLTLLQNCYTLFSGFFSFFYFHRLCFLHNPITNEIEVSKEE